MATNQKNKLELTRAIKNWICGLPLIGWLIRFINTFLHLNNLKFRISSNQEHIALIEQSFEDERIQLLKRIALLEESLENERIELLQRFALLEQSFKQSFETVQLHTNELEKNLDFLSQTIDKSIASQIYYQLHSLQHRIDLLESDIHVINPSSNILV